jgi:hypothetical protein
VLEIKPQRQPDLLRLSAMISQYFTPDVGQFIVSPLDDFKIRLRDHDGLAASPLTRGWTTLRAANST